LFGLRESPRIMKVAVAFETLAGHGPDFLDWRERPARGLAYEKRNHCSMRHV